MEGGDIFDVIDKSVDQLNEFVGTKKYEKKLFILTSGGGETSYNEKKIAKLINLIRRIDVKINFIAIDFIDKYDAEMDDPDDPEAFE